MDTLSKSERSERMKLIRNKDTKPELSVRRLIHGMGYRYIVHSGNLPGKPDIVFRKRRKIIFVHGCFWHRHACNLGRLPKSKLDFWVQKLEQNRLRDIENLQRLTLLGWKSLLIWECEIGNNNLANRIKSFLDD